MDTWIDPASFGVGIGGLCVSLGGLLFAILALRAAYMAKNAATSAKDAAIAAKDETQRVIGHNLSSMEVASAVEQISRLKELHIQANWQSALGNYQVLRKTLTEISGNLPAEFEQYRSGIQSAESQVTFMENRVTRFIFNQQEDIIAPRLNATLTTIQHRLETLLSKMKYPVIPGGE